ncbi:hypothetical protein MHBO_005025 [Bonamia ostreae]|uniref:Uncharacterized protein n=1 Tax=Bonamia ostreae TaxID=126728 RepID=A0ABV2AVQ2_9EUKA
MLQNFYLAKNQHIKNDRGFEEHDIKLIQNPDLKDKELEEYLRTVLDSNRLNLQNIELNDKNVFLEGLEDWIFFKLFVEDKVNDTTITFYPGRGASSLAPEISSCIAYSKNYIIIVDNDKGGKNAKTHYESKECFSYTDIDKRIKMIADIVGDKSIKTTTSLLSAND